MGYSILIIDNRQQRAQSLMGDQWDILKDLPNVTIIDTIPEQEIIDELLKKKTKTIFLTNLWLRNM